MGDSFTGLDFIVLLITLVIGYRIYMTLGKRTGNEKDAKKMQAIIAGEPEAKRPDTTLDMPMITGLSKIQTKDKSFSMETFTEGAKQAFEMILKAFVKGEKSALKPLLSAKMYAEFSDMIDTRTKKKQQAEMPYFRLVSAEILESDVVNKTAQITVKYKSEQTLLIKQGKKIIDGDPDVIDEVTDVWVFERKFASRSPNWNLETIKSFSEDPSA